MNQNKSKIETIVSILADLAGIAAYGFGAWVLWQLLQIYTEVSK